MGNFADNIRNLRKKFNLTQDELAGFLNVSFQTISKWEREERYPDITMLPIIARFFGISVDELLGVDESNVLTEQEELLSQWEADNAIGKNLENIQRMRMALKKYPGNYEMMLKLVTSLDKCQGTESEVTAYQNEAIELSERIIKHCPDAKMRNDVMYNICYSYWNKGDKQLAIERANQLSRLYKSQENALVMFLEGEEKIQTGQHAMVTLTSLMYHQISCMCREEYYSLDEKLELLEKYLEVSEILFEDEDVQEILHCRADAYVRIADIFLDKNMPESVYKSLKCVIDVLEKSEIIEEKQIKSEQTDMLVDDNQYHPNSLLSNAIIPQSVLNARYKKFWFVQQLEDVRYDKIRDTHEFLEICECVKELDNQRQK